MELGASENDVRTNAHHHHEKDEEDHHFHVLAVDDSLIDRKLLERLLTVSSYQVTCVESGDKALEYLGLLGIDEEEYESSWKQSSSQQEVSKINMIMTDYSMPGITGYDLLKRIKGSSWKNIPVVVMSSENVPSRIDMCLQGGAEEFLLKPVKPSDLQKLHSNLFKYTARRSLNRRINEEEDNSGIAIELNRESKVVCNKEDKESEDESSTCSSTTVTNKRKTISSTNTSTSTMISPDASERRARAQELSVS